MALVEVPNALAFSTMTSRAVSYAARVRPTVVAASLDALVVMTAVAVALVLRYDGAVPGGMWLKAEVFAVVAVAVFLAFGLRLGLYGHVWSYASVSEARRVLLAGGLATLVMTTLALALQLVDGAAFAEGSMLHQVLGGDPLPRSVPLIMGVLATGTFGLLRYQSRLFARGVQGKVVEGVPTLVVGAGDLGAWLVRQLQDGGPLRPVGFVDDDLSKSGRSVCGVRVLGITEEIAALVRAHGVESVVVAIADKTPALLRVVGEQARAAGVDVKSVPDASEILLKGMRPDDLRSLDTETLLGRASVRTDLTGAECLIRDQVVLVTGAGGSIGSEIARQVAAAQPRLLLALDNDETHLFDLMAGLPAAPAKPLLADVREEGRIRSLIAQYRPSLVFHAAAHKHVPILEEHPAEAIKTNVVGTKVLLEACEEFGVERFILVSTDKAVAPSSVMGSSKRIAEFLVADAARSSGRAYAAVRFGNVLGSRGSVVPTFARQIREGGPVTVTDPRMNRFFMTIPEATHLVLQAAAVAEGGDIIMLDMGQPVTILSLAEQMIKAAGLVPGLDIQIQVTGVRSGEKLEERLVDPLESVAETTHPSLRRVTPLPLESALLTEVVDRLRYLVAQGNEETTAREIVMLARDPGAALLTPPIALAG